MRKVELRERSGRGDAFRSSDYFDLVGGTSVGALLAALIALLGYSVSGYEQYLSGGHPTYSVARGSHYHF